MRIRPDTAVDIAGIRRVNQLAFGREDEARIVDRLRDTAPTVISLVADDDGLVVGHIMFSPVTLGDGDQPLVMGLGPMAVVPDRQRQTIGSALVHAGLEECLRLGVAGVVVVGHPAFYPRFGFVPASGFGLKCEFEVPDDVFMAVEFVDGSMRSPGRVIRYHPAFSGS